jgi:hypothetical protein
MQQMSVAQPTFNPFATENTQQPTFQPTFQPSFQPAFTQPFPNQAFPQQNYPQNIQAPFGSPPNSFGQPPFQVKKL